MASKPAWGKAQFHIHKGEGRVTITVTGRERWALECLMMAGPKGCTPIDHPGPRWAAYEFDLRQMGLEIDALTETHGQPFAGTHARYVLKSRVTRAEVVPL